MTHPCAIASSRSNGRWQLDELKTSILPSDAYSAHAQERAAMRFGDISKQPTPFSAKRITMDQTQCVPKSLAHGGCSAIESPYN